jgi:hypothetical protein
MANDVDNGSWWIWTLHAVCAFASVSASPTVQRRRPTSSVQKKSALLRFCAFLRFCVCACVRVCVCACVRVCACAFLRLRVRVFVCCVLCFVFCVVLCTRSLLEYTLKTKNLLKLVI